MVESTLSYGNKFGALCMIMPREAFIRVRGMDDRMRGWGGDDLGLVCALDTLRGPHFTLPHDIFHLWHPQIISGDWDPAKPNYRVRMWAGQDAPLANDQLAMRYARANGDPENMQAIIEERPEL